MTVSNDELLSRVLQCANRAAGTSISLPSDGDVPLSAFAFDSLSLFAFLLELERVCGMKFDEALLGDEQLRTIRSMASLIRERNSQARPGING